MKALSSKKGVLETVYLNDTRHAAGQRARGKGRIRGRGKRRKCLKSVEEEKEQPCRRIFSLMRSGGLHPMSRL